MESSDTHGGPISLGYGLETRTLEIQEETNQISLRLSQEEAEARRRQRDRAELMRRFVEAYLPGYKGESL